MRRVTTAANEYAHFRRPMGGGVSAAIWRWLPAERGGVPGSSQSPGGKGEPGTSGRSPGGQRPAGGAAGGAGGGCAWRRVDGNTRCLVTRRCLVGAHRGSCPSRRGLGVGGVLGGGAGLLGADVTPTASAKLACTPWGRGRRKWAPPETPSVFSQTLTSSNSEHLSSTDRTPSPELSASPPASH